MRKAMVCFIVAVAVAPATARADGPPAGQVAAQICTALQQQLGTGFAAKFASVDACVQQETPAAQTIVSNCTAKGQPGTDAYRQCVQDGITAAVQQVTGGGGGGVIVAPSAAQVAEDLCNDLADALGGTFAAQFGSAAQCEQQLGSAAQTIISGCAAKAQPGTAGFSACMHDGVDAAVQAQLALVDKSAGRSLAKQICTGLQKKLGAKAFGRKYGTAARCRARVVNAATSLAAGCRSTAKPDSGTYAQCVQQGVQATVRRGK